MIVLGAEAVMENPVPFGTKRQLVNCAPLAKTLAIQSRLAAGVENIPSRIMVVDVTLSIWSKILGLIAVKEPVFDVPIAIATPTKPEIWFEFLKTIFPPVPVLLATVKYAAEDPGSIVIDPELPPGLKELA